jgi:hypothetical protein
MAVEDVAPLQGYQPEIGLLAAIDGPMSMRPSPTAQDARLSSPLAATYAHLEPSKYLRHQFDRLWNEQMGAFALSALGRRVKWEPHFNHQLEELFDLPETLSQFAECASTRSGGACCIAPDRND